jgi:hypothetical protein
MTDRPKRPCSRQALMALSTGTRSKLHAVFRAADESSSPPVLLGYRSRFRARNRRMSNTCPAADVAADPPERAFTLSQFLVGRKPLDLQEATLESGAERSE